MIYAGANIYIGFRICNVFVVHAYNIILIATLFFEKSRWCQLINPKHTVQVQSKPH